MFMFYSVLTLPPIIPSGTVNEDKGSSSFSKRVKKKAPKTKRSHKHQISASGKILEHVIILTYQN